MSSILHRRMKINARNRARAEAAAAAKGKKGPAAPARA